MTTTATDRWRSRWARAADAPVDAASLVAFRVFFGLLLAVASARFVAKGWVAEHFVEPARFFPYWGLEWVRPLPGAGMYAVYALMTLSAIGVAAGRPYRASCAALFVTFSYAHLCDKTHYLNHYYLVSLLAAVLLFLPLGRAKVVPAWMLWLVRFQVGVVYFYAGVAKLQSDWLVHAQPLTIWLGRNTDVPILGAFFARKATAYAMSWAGAAFDLSVPFLLLTRSTRPFAFAAVVFFHALTARLFQLGMFPWFMTAFATVLFPPSWPRRWFGRAGARASPMPAVSRWPKVGAAVFAVVQVLVPLRHLLYPGNVLWTEEGFRFSWRVMLVEKSGSVEVSAVDRATGERFYVSPRDYLTADQARMASTQPDMLLQLAHMVRDDFRARGREVSVYVSADVAWNGRPAAPLVDPSVDLGAEEDGLAPKRWILPAPDTRPRF